MSSEQTNLSNPFARNLTQNQVKKPAVQAPKVDTMREQIKKQLLDSLEPNTDSSVKNLKFKSEELSMNLENAIFEVTGKNSKDKAYREKTKKIITRVKGTRNANVRVMLKSAIITVEQLCKLTDKQIDDDAYFNKIASENNIAAKAADAAVKGRLPKINIPIQSIDLLKSQEMNNSSTMEEYYNSNKTETQNAQSFQNNENVDPSMNNNSQPQSNLENNPPFANNDMNFPSSENNFNNFGETVSSNFVMGDENNYNNFSSNNNNFNNDFASQNTLNSNNNFEMLGHPASNNSSSTNGNMNFHNNYDDGFMVISQNNNKNTNDKNNNFNNESSNFNPNRNTDNDFFSNSNSNFNMNSNMNNDLNQNFSAANNFDLPRKNEEKANAVQEKKSTPPPFAKPTQGNKPTAIPIKNQSNIAAYNKNANTINYNKTIDIGELTSEKYMSNVNVDNNNSSYNANLTENEIENVNDSCNMSTSINKENDNPSQISDKLTELKKLRQKRQNKNLNMPLTLKSNSNISNILSQSSGSKNNIAYFNNPTEMDLQSQKAGKTDPSTTNKIENLNVQEHTYSPDSGTFNVLSDQPLNPAKNSSEAESYKNTVNLNSSKNENFNINQNINSVSKNPFDDEIPLHRKKHEDNNNNGKKLDNANIQLKLEELSHRNEIIEADNQSTNKTPNLPNTDNLNLERKNKNPFEESDSSISPITNVKETINEKSENKKTSFSPFEETNSNNIEIDNGESNSFRRHKPEFSNINSNPLPTKDLKENIPKAETENLFEAERHMKSDNKQDHISINHQSIPNENQINLVHQTPEQKQENINIQNAEFLPKQINRNLTKTNFPSDVNKSKSNLNNNNNISNDRLSKSAAEKLIILETNLDLALKKNEIYELEIKNLREKITEIRVNMVNSNEEVLRLEISKVKNSLLMKEQENNLLAAENNNLKSKVNSLESNIKSLLSDHSNFRKQTEQILKNQQNEFESLLRNKIEEIANFRSQFYMNNNFHNENPNANANDNNAIDYLSSGNNNNLTENASNIYIRDNNDTMNLVSTSNNNIQMQSNNFNANNNLNLHKDRKEIYSSAEESHFVSNRSNNANANANANANNLINIPSSELNAGINSNPYGNYINSNQNEDKFGNANVDENLVDNFYSNNNLNNLNNEDTNYINYEESNYNNRTNGNPFGGDDRGSDNYLNGNVYDEIKNKVDHSSSNNHTNFYPGGNSNNNFNINSNLSGNNANNLNVNNDAYENYENNMHINMNINNNAFDDFNFSNKQGNTGDAFNDGYSPNNANTSDVKKAESGATNATKDIFGYYEEEKVAEEEEQSNANNLFYNNQTQNTQANTFFNANPAKNVTSTTTTNKNPDRHIRPQANANTTNSQPANFFEDFGSDNNNNANSFFSGGNNQNDNSKAKILNANQVSTRPRSPPTASAKQDNIKITANKNEALSKNNSYIQNSNTNNNLNASGFMNNANSDNLNLNKNSTSKSSNLFGEDENDAENIFSKGFGKAEADKKTSNLNSKNQINANLKQNVNPNNSKLNAFNNNLNKNKQNAEIADWATDELNSSKYSEKSNSRFINANSSSIAAQSKKFNNNNNIFNNSNIIENPNNSLFDDTDNKDANSFFGGGHNNSMMVGKKENIFTNKNQPNANPNQASSLKNASVRTPNLNTNKPNVVNKNKKINIFEGNQFEHEKNAFDFFDKKDDGAENIFESLSRTSEQKNNQKSKGSGLFG